MSRIQPIAMIILALVVLPYRAVRRGKNAPGRGPKKGGRPALEGAAAIGRPMEQIEGGRWSCRARPFPISRATIGLATRAHRHNCFASGRGWLRSAGRVEQIEVTDRNLARSLPLGAPRTTPRR
jgi:hypothetical protein